MIGRFSPETAARKGAGFLDSVNPNWYKRVNPETINIASPCDCIMGQVYGDFVHGVVISGFIEFMASRLARNKYVDYGFAHGEWHPLAWRELDDAWRTEVYRRRFADCVHELGQVECAVA